MSVLIVEPAAAPVLTAGAARALTERLRGALVVAYDLLADAYAGRAWEALGYPSWAAYCRAELVLERSLRLPRAERADVVERLAGAGMPKRAIAASLGVADQTVRADLARGGQPSPALAAAVEQAVPKTAQVVLRLLDAGPRGMTVHELSRATGWHHGSTSAILHALTRQRRAVRATTFRAGAAVHVHPAHAPR